MSKRAQSKAAKQRAEDDATFRELQRAADQAEFDEALLFGSDSDDDTPAEPTASVGNHDNPPCVRSLC